MKGQGRRERHEGGARGAPGLLRRPILMTRTPGPGPTRRDFALALAGALPLLAAPAEAAAPPTRPRPAKPPSAAEQADALKVLLRARFGKYLSNEQLEQVMRRLQTGRAAAAHLTTFALTNADEPDFVFTADLP